MKVLVVTQYFWPESFRINEVVDSLRLAGCEVTVLTGQPNYPEGVIRSGYSAYSMQKEVHGGVPIYRVPMAPRGRGTATRLTLNYLSFVASGTVFGTWLLRGQKFDAIFVYAPSPILQAIPAVWLKWIKRAVLVTWIQDLWPESLSATGFVHDKRILGIVGAVVRWIYRKNDLLLVSSQAFVKPVVQASGGTPVIYHPNPGELAFLTNGNDRPPNLRLDSGFNVVFAGNLGTVQALDTVVAAALLLRDENDVKFVLVGSGSRSDWVKSEVQRLGLDNVSMPGRFPPSEMPGIFSQASVLLVSLTKDPVLTQTVPSKVQAYLAAGRPIIASLDGEGARVVKEANAGLACPAGDPQALASAIRKIRNALPEDREKMARSGRSYYEQHFEPNLLAGRLIQILTEQVTAKVAADKGKLN